MAKVREIIAIYTERPSYGDLDIFKVGDPIGEGEVIKGIERSIGGLDKISAAGPATLGPNCPTFIVTILEDETLRHIAIPERTVDAVVYEEKLKGDPEIKMTRE